MQKDLRGRDMLAIAAVAVSMAYGVALAVSDACARAGFDGGATQLGAGRAPVTIPVALGLIALAERRSLPR
jgi:hypothetical protein